MQRHSFTMKLKAGFEAEYKKRHNEIWPELYDALKKSGIIEYSIFLDPKSLVLTGFILREDKHTMDQLPHLPIMKKWWAFMSDIMDSNPDNSPLVKDLIEVFYIK